MTAFSNRDSVGCEAKRSPETGSLSSSSLWTGSSARRSPSLQSGWPQAMPKMRWPTRSASECRVLSGARLVEQTPGERLDQTVDALGGLQQNRPAVGTGLLLVELGEQRLVKQIREQNSLWYSVGRHTRASVVAQVVVNTALVPYGGSCVCTGIGTRHEFSGLTPGELPSGRVPDMRAGADDVVSDGAGGALCGPGGRDTKKEESKDGE